MTAEAARSAALLAQIAGLLGVPVAAFTRAPHPAPDWIDRAAWCAEGLLAILPTEFGEAREDGGIPHLRWMARQLAERRLDSETKACRWLGYLQAGAVFGCMSTLEDEKERNLASKVEAPIRSSQGHDHG